MILTDKVQKALVFAAQAHKDQTRKASEGTPYMVHPFAVALLLAYYQCKENIICAGFLHDTIEDTETTKQDIQKAFGKEIAELVSWETEEDKSMPWAERKRAALTKLSSAPVEALYMKSADAISNMRDMITGYNVQGEDFWTHFKRGKSDQIARYGALVSTICKRKSEFGSYERDMLNELRDTYDTLASLF